MRNRSRSLLTCARIANLETRMRASWVGALWMLSAIFGCGGGPPTRSADEIDRSLQQYLRWSSSETESQLAWPKCTIPAGPGKCGLLVQQTATREYAQAFVDAHCPPTDTGDRVTDACLALAREEFLSAMPARYPKGKAAEVDQFCASNAAECSTLLAVEIQWLKSHNAAVISEGKRRDERLIYEHVHENELAASTWRRREAETDRLGTSLLVALRMFGAGAKGYADSWNGR